MLDHGQKGSKTLADSTLEEAMKKNFPGCGSFKDIIAGKGLEIEHVLRNSPMALSLTILGGAGERLL